ncbi:MAG: ADP-ribosylation factor-like protein [Candidatus Thorarchaeota archaeon]
MRILLFGLERSGKTTLVNSFQAGQFTEGTPFTAQSLSELTYNNTHFSILEIGGRREVRNFVSEFVGYVDAIIFVIDGSDERKFDEVASEFQKILTHPQSTGKPIAVLFHKNDIALIHPSIIIERLDLLDRYDRPHRVFLSTAQEPREFERVLTWIQTRLNEDETLVDDQEARLFRIYILDMLNNQQEGLAILALLGQLEIMARTGQVSYDRDKILTILRKSRAAGELEFNEHYKIWKVTEKGKEILNTSDLIESSKYEKIKSLIDESNIASGSSKDKESIGYREQKELLEEFDLEELAELYKKKSDEKRGY